LTGGIVGIVMALNGYGVWSLVGQRLASGAVGVLVLWKVSPWRPKFRVSRVHGRDLFRFGVNVMGSNVMHFISQQTDRVLIGYFLGATVLGYYTVALRLIAIIQELFSRSLSAVVYSMFSRIQNDTAQLRRAFLSIVQLVAFIAFPVFTFIAAAGHELVGVIFGDRWLPSVPIVRIIAFAAMLDTVNIYIDAVFKSKGKPRLAFNVALIRAGIGLILFSVAVRWGIVAMAGVWLVRVLIVTPIAIVWMRRLIQLDLKKFMLQFRVPFVGALGVAASVYGVRYLFMPEESVMLLIMQLTISAIIYFLIAHLLDAGLLRRFLELGRSVFPGIDASKRGG